MRNYYYNILSVAGSEQEKQRFKNDVTNCAMDQNCTCNIICPLTKLLNNKMHCIGKKPVIDVYAGKYGFDFEVETKNTTFEHIVKVIATSYPSLIFKVSVTSNSSNNNISETFIYRNNLTLVADSRSADKNVSFLDSCGQIVQKGSRITTANGDVMIIDDISSKESKMSLSLRCGAGGAVAVSQIGLIQDEVTRLNYWDEIVDFMMERININPVPLFEPKNAIVSDSLVKVMKTYDDLLTPQICLFLVGHSYGYWGVAEENIVTHNNEALKKGGHLISKYEFLDDIIIVFTDVTWSETKMFLVSEMTSAQNT